MKIIEVYKCLSVPVKYNVKKGNSVLILTDTSVEEEIYHAVMMACLEVEAHPVLMIIPPIRVWGNEPLTFLKSMINDIDVLINACSTGGFVHTNTFREIRRGRKKRDMLIISLAGRKIDNLLEGAGTADLEEVRRITNYFADAITDGEQVRVTTPKGTDITLSVKGRSGKRLTGFIPEHGDIVGFPSGEAACAPLEGTTEGTIVIDTVMQKIGICKIPIVLNVKKGIVTKIEGGTEAENLKTFLEDSGDEYSYHIAEFAIGSNPKARLTGDILEDKRKLGTIHFAIGNNLTLGGAINSKTHLDGVCINALVVIDGKKILENGKPCW